MSTQLINDPDDPILSTTEYAYIYAQYGGFWNRHVDTSDNIFTDIWEILDTSPPSKTFFQKQKPTTMEQVYRIGDTDYRALWFQCAEFSRKILGPPDIITWRSPMLPPNHVQLPLF